MVLLLEEINLERKDGVKLIYIAFDVFNAILLPRPYLWGYIIKYGYVCTRFYILRYLKIKAGIINQNNTIWLPLGDISLTHLHIAKYCG